MPPKPISTLQGQIIKETEKAVLISFTNGRESWVPKSVITSDIQVALNSTQEFDIAQWFVEKNHLILKPSNENIIGRSGSVMHLKRELLHRGIDGFETFEEIQTFKKNFKTILATSTQEERDKLTAIIEALKTDEEKLVQKIEEKKALFKEALLEEKKQLEIGEMSSKDEKRVKKIDKILEKKLDKPFKKELKQVKKTDKEVRSREKNLEKSVQKSVKDLHKANIVLKKNPQLMSGAVGETIAIKELKKLPEEYHTLNEVHLSFSKSIRWRKYHDYVKSCTIDHVVVGPTGIFLIETKNWSAQTLRNARFTPHKQIDRAGYIFFIHMMDYFGHKFPFFKVVATLRDLPQLNYAYVDQMMIRDLVNYILQKKKVLTADYVQRIKKWLNADPHIYNQNPRSFFPYRRRRLRLF